MLTIFFFNDTEMPYHCNINVAVVHLEDDLKTYRKPENTFAGHKKNALDNCNYRTNLLILTIRNTSKLI